MSPLHGETEDPIEVVRWWQEARLLEASACVLPHLDEVSFTDASSLKTAASGVS